MTSVPRSPEPRGGAVLPDVTDPTGAMAAVGDPAPPAPEIAGTEGGSAPGGGAGSAGGTPPGRGGRADDAGIARSSLAMAGGTIASRVLGVVRQSLIIAAVGAALAGEAFTAANIMPNVIYMIIAGGVLNSVLIPQLVRATKNADGGREFTDRILTVGGALLLAVTVVCTAGAGILMRVTTDLSGDALHLATLFAFITIPQIFFYGLYALLGQVLNSRGQFAAFGWSPAIANVVAIAGLLAFLVLFHGQAEVSDWTGPMIWLLGGTATASIAVQGIILLFPLYRNGFRFTPRWGLRGVGLGQATQVAKWAFGALAVSQLGYVLASRIMTSASNDQTTALFIAGVTVYSSALLVFQMPHSFVALSVITAMYPRISKAAQEGDNASLRRDYRNGLTVPTALTLPASVALAVFALPICRLLFNAHPGDTALVLAAMALGVVPFGIDVLNQRFFYAHNDGRMAFAEQCVLTGSATAINVAAWFLAPPQYLVAVIGAGIVLSNILSSVFGLWFVRERIGRIGGGRVVRAYVRIGLASAVSGGVAWLVVLGCDRLLGDSRVEQLVPLLLGGGVFLFFYLTLAALLEISEVGDLIDPAVRGVARLLRRG